MGKYDDLLFQGLTRLGLDVSAPQVEQLKRYIAEIELFNPIYKLVGASGDELIINHIFDSLAGVRVIDEVLAKYPSPTLADVGSGAGLPGIPLAIALEGLPVTLIERMGRRVDFLRTAVASVGLVDRVKIIDRDIKEVKERFDVITFRAFRPLAEILDSVAPLVSDGGVVVAYKALRTSVEEELEDVANRLKTQWEAQLIELDVPFLDRSRILCLLHKI
ncbi:MAG: 16S rRNA (guanine(527)-N(7))-methyltransferase RsmG [Sphaerochaeta sp.]